MSRGSNQQVYGGVVRVFSSAIVLFGVIMLVATLVQGGGPFSVGVVLGIAFIGLGLARFYLARVTR